MCHVLIIEDEALAALDIEATLRSAGATTFAFADTERQAVEEAQRRRPAVIISDFMLSDGSGPSAVSTIRGEFGPIPTIFVTAIPEHIDGETHVMEKPFSQVELAHIFRSVAPRLGA